MEKKAVLTMGGYGMMKSPGKINSGGYGPCIVIGIYDSRKKIAYMFHDDDGIMGSEDTLGKFLNCVLNNSKKENLRIEVSGGYLYDDEG
ncbi:MAG: hypothetical protein ABUT20_43505, partial [Bacteroidota bacterium]